MDSSTAPSSISRRLGTYIVIVMACIVMAYMAMACIVTAYIVMAGEYFAEAGDLYSYGLYSYGRRIFCEGWGPL